MLQRFLVIADPSVEDVKLAELRNFSQALADVMQEPVGMSHAGKHRMRALRTSLLSAGGLESVEHFAPKPLTSAAPMSSAPFVWREDGRPDWAEMWTSFCELALYGGPPHRGEDEALHAPEIPNTQAAPEPEWDAVLEIRRGIWETTGLIAEPDEPGWIVVTCESKRMAAWLCACIILENVDARCDEERLYLPCDPSFRLKNEVKSVITVLAKTHHYWQAHIQAQEQAQEKARELASATA